MSEKPVLTFDGATFQTFDQFAEEFSKAVFGTTYFKGNLDALNDMLAGGFGSPIGGFVLRWENSAASRQTLGYPETTKWIESHLQTCHHSNIPDFHKRLEDAQAGRGLTLFDIVVEIIRDNGHGGQNPEGGIELLLL
jgi:RNAse (barnase) inhibitor barstar